MFRTKTHGYFFNNFSVYLIFSHFSRQRFRLVKNDFSNTTKRFFDFLFRPVDNFFRVVDKFCPIVGKVLVKCGQVFEIVFLDKSRREFFFP